MGGVTLERKDAPSAEAEGAKGSDGSGAQPDANGMVTQVTRRLELDGLRGVAILLVVFAHAMSSVGNHDRGLAPEVGSLGGLVGVQLFFVLSGYLITGILLRGGGLRRFYMRRVRRLAPTLVVVVAVSTLWSRDWVGALRALTYTENLMAGGHGQGTFRHTWSLAVEEQFYLVWPLVLLACRRYAVHLAAFGIAATVLAQQSVDWSEMAVYGGLRWDAVLAGCLIALTGWRADRRFFIVGAALLGAYTLGLTGPMERIDYPIATLASVLVVASAHTMPALAAGWLRHLGHISYALYLWHVATLRLDLPTPVTLVLGLALAEVTYLLVDRRAQLGQAARTGRSRIDERPVAVRLSPAEAVSSVSRIVNVVDANVAIRTSNVCAPADRPSTTPPATKW